MWLIEEKATSRFRSRWASETIDPQTIEANATTKRTGWTLVEAERQHEHRPSDQPVAAELQEQPREQDRTPGRRLDVGVRQPRVERDDRELDAEPEEERRGRGTPARRPRA